MLWLLCLLRRRRLRLSEVLGSGMWTLTWGTFWSSAWFTWFVTPVLLRLVDPRGWRWGHHAATHRFDCGGRVHTTRIEGCRSSGLRGVR